MNSGSSYALKSARFLVIFIFIGIVRHEAANFAAGTDAVNYAPEAHPNASRSDVLQAFGTRRDRGKERWRPLPGDIDIMLLRNQPRHVIEGIGGAGMLLGESEVQLRHKYGEPAYRDHASPETLYYTEETFSAQFRLKNGRITEILLEVEKHKWPSLEWFTALGLHETDLRGHSAETAAPVLSQFYGTTRLRQVGDRVDVLSRGIGFRFRGKSVIAVIVCTVDAYPD